MTLPTDGRESVDPKFLWTVASALVLLGIVWGTLKADVSAQGGRLVDQAQQLAVLDEEQDRARLASTILSNKVDVLAGQLSDVQVEQKAQGKEQQTMRQELFEQRTILNTILEEVKKP